jgi:hypothetical protein
LGLQYGLNLAYGSKLDVNEDALFRFIKSHTFMTIEEWTKEGYSSKTIVPINPSFVFEERRNIGNPNILEVYERSQMIKNVVALKTSSFVTIKSDDYFTKEEKEQMLALYEIRKDKSFFRANLNNPDAIKIFDKYQYNHYYVIATEIKKTEPKVREFIKLHFKISTRKNFNGM